MISGACVFIHSHRLKDGTLKYGLLLYPGDRGKFKTEESKQRYADLFTGAAPFLPYAEVGNRYANTQFTDTEKQAAILKHMKSKGWEPKEANEAFWAADRAAQDSLVFPLGAVRERIEEGETPLQCAVRGGVGRNGYEGGPTRAEVQGTSAQYRSVRVVDQL